jgi:hypothetical protein
MVVRETYHDVWFGGCFEAAGLMGVVFVVMDCWVGLCVLLVPSVIESVDEVGLYCIVFDDGLRCDTALSVRRSRQAALDDAGVREDPVADDAPRHQPHFTFTPLWRFTLHMSGHITFWKRLLIWHA